MTSYTTSFVVGVKVLIGLLEAKRYVSNETAELPVHISLCVTNPHLLDATDCGELRLQSTRNFMVQCLSSTLVGSQ